jgi:hypothetical protein
MHLGEAHQLLADIGAAAAVEGLRSPPEESNTTRSSSLSFRGGVRSSSLSLDMLVRMHWLRGHLLEAQHQVQGGGGGPL